MTGEYSINKELNHVYQDIDRIRLVWENGELVGWYRPDGGLDEDEPDGYAVMAKDMLE